MTLNDIYQALGADWEHVRLRLSLRPGDREKVYERLVNYALPGVMTAQGVEIDLPRDHDRRTWETFVRDVERMLPHSLNWWSIVQPVTLEAA